MAHARRTDRRPRHRQPDSRHPGHRGFVRPRQHPPSRQSEALSAVALARARAGQARRHHGVHAGGRSGRRQGPQALSGALHPRRGLRGAARRDVGDPQPQPGRDPVRRHRAQDAADHAHVRHHRPRGADLGSAHRSSATPTCWSRNMAMGRDLAKTLGKGRTALMRGHGCVVVGPDLRAHRLHRGLSRAERQAADAGRGDGQGEVPHQGRGRTRSSRPPRRPTSTAPGRTGAARRSGRTGSSGARQSASFRTARQRRSGIQERHARRNRLWISGSLASRAPGMTERLFTPARKPAAGRGAWRPPRRPRRSCSSTSSLPGSAAEHQRERQARRRNLSSACRTPATRSACRLGVSL